MDELGVRTWGRIRAGGMPKEVGHSVRRSGVSCPGKIPVLLSLNTYVILSFLYTVHISRLLGWKLEYGVILGSCRNHVETLLPLVFQLKNEFLHAIIL